MKTLVHNNPEEAAIKTAVEIANLIRENPGKLVCFAAGDTPLGMLRELINLQKTGEVDLNSVYYAGLDEWVGLGYDDKGSCIQVMRDNFYNPAGIRPERICFFDGLADDMHHEARLMEEWIKKHGGMYLTVLGVGMNGHVGFNEPNTPEVEGCLVTELDDITKKVSEKYFDCKKNILQGITIGWKMLLSAEHLYIMATGEKKAAIINKAFCEEPGLHFPASLMRRHLNLTLVLDVDAASKSFKK